VSEGGHASGGGRATFGSFYGALMAFIGVAVGLGNFWRFPYMAAAFGGGAFLLVYCAIVLVFGVPAIAAEFALGRLTRRNPLGAFRAVGMPGGRAAGWMVVITIFVASSYYAVVVGWVLVYFAYSLTGAVGTARPDALFQSLLGGFPLQLGATALVLGLGALVLLLGVRRGIERVSAIGLPLLFVLLLVLLVRVLSLPGVGAGVRFYLVPDFSKIDAGVVAAALGQVFFSLSLGGTFHVTYGSYLGGDVDLPRSAWGTAIGDTLAAVFAGFLVVPAAAMFGLDLSSGPPLTFVTVPRIFAHVAGGTGFAALFFGLLFFAAFLSSIAGLEVVIAMLVDEFHVSRRAAVLGVCAVELVLALPAMKSLAWILKSDLFWGSTMQPLGSACALVALAWVVGKGRALEEVRRGAAGGGFGTLWFYWIRYVVPLGIVVILALGIKDVFATFFGSR
jgi:neurotransmitter:Na+ symporter, NSS family